MRLFLVSFLVIGAAFLIASVAVYLRARPWRSKNGLMLLSILANFALVKIFAIMIVLDILHDLTLLWWTFMCILVGINGVQVFFMILAIQRDTLPGLRKERYVRES